MTLLSREHNSPSAWQGSLPVTNRYTYGLAGERFFRAFKEQGTILGTVCQRCNVTYVPGRVFCERCLNELETWVDVGTTGEIYTFTMLYVEYDGTPCTSPEIIAFVQFGDGGLVHKLAEIDPSEVYIGMPVEAVFKPPAERQGSIQDILYFKPSSG